VACRPRAVARRRSAAEDTVVRRGKYSIRAVGRGDQQLPLRIAARVRLRRARSGVLAAVRDRESRELSGLVVRQSGRARVRVGSSRCSVRRRCAASA
jgi:hypothetical protein